MVRLIVCMTVYQHNRNLVVNKNNDRKLQHYKSMTVTLLRCVTELLQCYFVIVQPRRSTNRPSTIGSGDRHLPTSPPLSSFRLREHRTSTSGAPGDRCTRASDACVAASRDSPALSVWRRLPRPSGDTSAASTPLGAGARTNRWNAEFQDSHMLFVLSAPVTVATWTFHTSGANRGGCRRIRAGGRGAAELTVGG